MIKIIPLNEAGELIPDEVIVFERLMEIGEYYGWSKTTATITDTLRGVIKQESTRSEKGRPLTLVARDGYGRQSVKLVRALEYQASQKGGKFRIFIGLQSDIVGEIIAAYPAEGTYNVYIPDIDTSKTISGTGYNVGDGVSLNEISSGNYEIIAPGLTKIVSYRTENAKPVEMKPAFTVDGPIPLDTPCDGSIYYMVDEI